MTEIFHTMEQRHNEYYAKGVEVARVSDSATLQYFSGNADTWREVMPSSNN